MMRASVAPVRVLVTGFGPFPGVPQNASAALADALAAGDPIAGVKLSAEVIPVVWEGAMEAAEALFAKHRPDAVLHFGVARSATAFEIETRAFNMSETKVDHVGIARPPKRLLPSSPAIIETTLPAAPLLRALKAAGYPAALSKDAGRYLCNALLYYSLAGAGGAPRPLVTFIHVPALEAAPEVTPLISMQDLVDGARILVRASANAVLRARRREAQRKEKGNGANGSQAFYRNGRGSRRFVRRGAG
jgi:pyroglutamyl-peptidase